MKSKYILFSIIFYKKKHNLQFRLHLIASSRTTLQLMNMMSRVSESSFLSHARHFNQNDTPWAPLAARCPLEGAQQQHKLSLWEEGSQGGLLDHGRQNLDRGRNYLGVRFFAIALLLTGKPHVLLASVERLGVDVCGLMRSRSNEHANWENRRADRNG